MDVRKRQVRLMKYLKLWKVLLLILMVGLLVLPGCGTDRADSNAAEREEIQIMPQIGICFDSFVIERWLRDRDLFDATARQLGAEVNVQAANGSWEEQISQIEYFIKKKVDVIVIVAVDSARLSDVVAKAKKEGIRVICYDRLVMNCNSDLYISFNNEKVGKLMGKAMKKALPDGGDIIMIGGSPVDYNVAMVENGFMEEIEDSGIHVLSSYYCSKWLAELAFDAAEEALTEHPGEIAGIMCGNDDLASQALRALSENRLAGKVVLTGQDAELAACQRIVEGTQTMTVYKRVEDLARKAAEYACAFGYEKLMKEGKKKPEEVPESLLHLIEDLENLPALNDGSYDIPYFAIDPIAVTKENMDEIIIGDDFHTREDVYLLQTDAEVRDER